MWRNTKISTKLLLGFGLVLLVFAIAVFATWRNLAELQIGSGYMDRAVVPAMSVTNRGERGLYELFLTADTMTLTESEASIKAVNDMRESVMKVLGEVGVLLNVDSDIPSLSYAKAHVAPLIDKYCQMLTDTEKAIQKKNATFALLVSEGEKLAESSTEYVKDILSYLQEEARNGRVTEEQVLVLDAAESTRTSLLLLRYTILRNIANKDMDALSEAVTETLDETEKTLTQLRNTADQPRFQAETSALLEEITKYRTFVVTFIEDFTALQKVHADRRPVMETLNGESSAASEIGRDQVAEFAREILIRLGSCITLLFVAAALSIILGLVIAVLLSRSITKPLSTIVALARRAGEGDLTVEKSEFGYEGKDELGVLADALSEMIGTQEDTLEQVVAVAENLSNAANSLSAISEETNASMEEVKASVEQVSTLSEGNGAALQECNAGVEEMSAGADTVAQSATDSASFIAQTTEVSNRAIQMVNNVIQGMHNVDVNSKESESKTRQLVSSVENVSGFVSVITGIADQTNLLALNAAIEAARAGEVGRGFAVVAEEVRKLAEESARAAQSVNSIIGELQSGAQESIKATTEAGRALVETITEAEQAQVELNGAMKEMNKANDSIQNIAAVAQEQAASSKEVATAIDSATKSTMEMVETISNIRNASEETAQAAQGVAEQSESMSGYAQSLMDALSRFRLKNKTSEKAAEKKGVEKKSLERSLKRR
jgi:methyl-accepting chemotaxis protein